jgi:hypothetical protein
MARIPSNTASTAARFRAEHEARAQTTEVAGLKSEGMLPVAMLAGPLLAVDYSGQQVGILAGGLTADLRSAILAYAHSGGDMSALLRVHVVQDGASVDDDVPDVAGRHALIHDALRFDALMSFERNLCYRAIFDLRGLGVGRFASDILILNFSIESTRKAEPPEVLHVYPSCESLPENLLRFYIRFSNSMQRGYAAKEIVVLDADGATVPDVLYRAPVELWDREMRILTVLLDPGRLKRAVGPNRELGAPMKVGKTYGLAIGTGVLDSSGYGLRHSIVKRFNVTEAVRARVDLMSWSLALPATNTRQQLVLMFPSSLDWALLSNSVAVLSAEGCEVDGRIVIDESETRWAFTPAAAWTAGKYRVRVASGLEDVCGNNTLTAFDTAFCPDSEQWPDTASPTLGFEMI